MRALIVLSALVAAGFWTFAVTSGQQPQTVPLPVWQADSEAVFNLSQEVSTSVFKITPPKDYEMFQPEGTPGNLIWGWKGPQRYDRTSPALLVNIVTPPASETNFPPPEVVLDKFLAGIARRRVNWQCSAIESGKINNVLFTRAHWSGAETAHGEPMHGIMYTATIPPYVVILSSQDVDRHSEKALPRAEAAFLTFKIIPQN